MDWETYKRIELANALVIFTARDDGKLRGFVMYVLAKHPHHKGMRFATCDIIAVDPDYRGMGIARSLIEYAEEQFKRYVYNVQAVIHNYRTIYDVEPLFEKMGFHNVESVYMKVL
jgi:GNAT superfamily N-acetyltransferase